MKAILCQSVGGGVSVQANYEDSENLLPSFKRPPSKKGLKTNTHLSLGYGNPEMGVVKPREFPFYFPFMTQPSSQHISSL